MAGQSASVLQGTTIVDTDVHLSVPTEDLAPYLDEPHRGHISNPTYSPLPKSGWDRSLGGKIQPARINGYEDLQPLVDDFGVDYPILNATSVLPRLPQTDLAVNLMSAYNDYLLDEYLDRDDSLYGLATVATQDPEAAAAELDRLGDESQIVGAYVCTTGPDYPVGDSRYDVVYRAAEDNDLTVTYHASGGAFMFDFPLQNRQYEQFLEVHTLSHLWSQMQTMTSVLVNGTPEKFPDLDFVFLEAGLAWIPMMMFRLNKEYSIRRSEAPLLRKSPEEYVRDFYFASQPVGEPNDPNHLRQVIEMVGVDSIMFASDYPHWDFDHPSALDDHLRAFFDDEERERVLHDNAREAFGF
jgi:predicted TIM-barrel fold metal-dependent hydrolase